MGTLPGVSVILGNGGLGRTASSSDGVAGLVLTGSAVAGKLDLNKAYTLSSARDLTALGVTAENNPLAEREVRAFYTAAGDGAELYLLVVSAATTLTAMADSSDTSPVRKVIDASGGRIRLLGLNRIPPPEYEAVTTEGIDGDAITAAAAAHALAESYAGNFRPFRVLLPAPSWTGETEDLYKPSEASYNRVGMVIASDSKVGAAYPAAVGLVLGRAAGMEPQRSVGRVRSGAIAASGFFTSGHTYLEKSGMAEALNAAGYMFFMSLPSKNGCYLNGDPMAAAPTDDYSELHLGRIIDKAIVIAYSTYIEYVMDNIEVDKDGRVASGACKSYEGIINNAVSAGMAGQISAFSSYVNPEQNVLSNGELTVNLEIVPLGVLRRIAVNLSFRNPGLAN